MKLTLITALALIQLCSAAYADDNQLKADREAVNSACTAEAATASCGEKEVGSGLLKCIHTYKKAHRKDFKISEGCKTAMKKLKEDRHEKHEK